MAAALGGDAHGEPVHSVKRGSEGYFNAGALVGLGSKRDASSYLHRFAQDFEDDESDGDGLGGKCGGGLHKEKSKGAPKHDTKSKRNRSTAAGPLHIPARVLPSSPILNSCESAAPAAAPAVVAAKIVAVKEKKPTVKVPRGAVAAAPAPSASIAPVAVAVPPLVVAVPRSAVVSSVAVKRKRSSSSVVSDLAVVAVAALPPALVHDGSAKEAAEAAIPVIGVPRVRKPSSKALESAAAVAAASDAVTQQRSTRSKRKPTT